MTLLKNPTIWFYASLGTMAASIAIIFFLGLNWGVDFVGGSLLEIKGSQENIQPIKTHISQEFDFNATVQTTQEDTLIIRLPEIGQDVKEEIVSSLQEQQLVEGPELRFESIGPTIGQELRQKSLTAIAAVIIGMITYLAYTFRNMKGLVEPWKFGVAAVYALVHDILFVTAAFAVFGYLWGAPVTTLFVTALLAILGYSVNDTIILFSRMRTIWRQDKNAKLDTITNKAIDATLGRTFNTSFTTLLVLFSLLLFGGSSIQWFIAALITGTIAGTYSSWFVAPPLLYMIRHK